MLASGKDPPAVATERKDKQTFLRCRGWGQAGPPTSTWSVLWPGPLSTHEGRGLAVSSLSKSYLPIPSPLQVDFSMTFGVDIQTVEQGGKP